MQKRLGDRYGVQPKPGAEAAGNIGAVVGRLAQLVWRQSPQIMSARDASRLSVVVALCTGSSFALSAPMEPETVRFNSDGKVLGGELFKPAGPGPFPAVLYNHGSAQAMLSSQASRAIAPLFVQNGWVFFMPFRRGQGLSADAGPYIGEELAKARRRGGLREASEVLVRLMREDHLADQLSALSWLKTRDFVEPARIAVAGNSFGGVQAILGASTVSYCAVVAGSAASESWAMSPELQEALKQAIPKAKAPVFLFQAQNDFDLTPNREMELVLTQAGVDVVKTIYPAFGMSKNEGHAFAYAGANTWFPEVFAFLGKHCN